MKPPKVSLQTIEQEVDLQEITGVDLSEARPIKEAIAQAIIDRITERTQGGDGLRFSRNGSATPVTLKSPYSKTYSETIEFKAAGKSTRKVNMTLTGDMLASVDVMSVGGNTIRFGITDATQVAKAYNHIVGDTVPARPWFGISKSELEDIVSGFRSEINEIKRGSERVTVGERKNLNALDLLKGMIEEGEE